MPEPSREMKLFSEKGPEPAAFDIYVDAANSKVLRQGVLAISLDGQRKRRSASLALPANEAMASTDAEDIKRQGVLSIRLNPNPRLPVPPLPTSQKTRETWGLGALEQVRQLGGGQDPMPAQRSGPAPIPESREEASSATSQGLLQNPSGIQRADSLKAAGKKETRHEIELLSSQLLAPQAPLEIDTNVDFDASRGGEGPYRAASHPSSPGLPQTPDALGSHGVPTSYKDREATQGFRDNLLTSGRGPGWKNETNINASSLNSGSNKVDPNTNLVLEFARDVENVGRDGVLSQAEGKAEKIQSEPVSRDGKAPRVEKPQPELQAAKSIQRESSATRRLRRHTKRSLLRAAKKSLFARGRIRNAVIRRAALVPGLPAASATALEVRKAKALASSMSLSEMQNLQISRGEIAKARGYGSRARLASPLAIGR